MAIKDDGDIVHGLGFVTLYAAYMEEAIDECVTVVVKVDPNPPKRIERWPISERVDYLRNRLTDLGVLPTELMRFPDLLVHIDGLLRRRNEVVHGRIYSGMQGEKDELRPGRPNGSLRAIDSVELYELANSLFATLSPLNQAAWFALPRLVK